jgi:hypothetical protein
MYIFYKPEPPPQPLLLLPLFRCGPTRALRCLQLETSAMLHSTCVVLSGASSSCDSGRWG